MTVKAPFRFARVNRWVYEPPWGPLVTHDVPFKDGLSGSAVVEITARTPILIGGTRRKAAADLAGEVMPFQMPDGTYALPGSAVQGMCRSLLEIVCFGRLGPWIEDQRFGIRDLSPTLTADLHYKTRLSTLVPATRGAPAQVQQHSLAGWLIKKDDKPHILPCGEPARIHYSDIEAMRAGLAGVAPVAVAAGHFLFERKDASVRFDHFFAGRGLNLSELDACFAISPTRMVARPGRPFDIPFDRARPSPTGTPGTLVLTGKGNTGVAAGNKKYDFVFHTPDRPTAATMVASAIEVENDVWKAFELLHKASPGRPANPNWSFWEAEYDAGRPVAIFYWIEGGRISTFGTAFAFKAAHTRSTGQLLDHSTAKHRNQASGKLDLPHLIFGCVAGAEHEGDIDHGLKRRASFGMGHAQLPTTTTALTSTGPGRAAVLLGPKPNYYPIYVRQNKTQNSKLPDNEPYATYSPVTGPKHLLEPELAGVKIWPAVGRCNVDQLDRPPPRPNGQPNYAIQSNLHALSAGTVFRVPLTFHNLRPMELGALLWVLSFGDRAALGDDPDAVVPRHRLGMGKPLHLGEVTIRVTELSGCHQAIDPVVCLEAFEATMQTAYAAGEPNVRWRESAQVKAVLKAAALNDFDAMGYMALGVPGNAVETYAGERKESRFLPDFAEGHERPRNWEPRPAAPPGVEPFVGAQVEMCAGHNVRPNEAGRIGTIQARRDHAYAWRVTGRGITTNWYPSAAFRVVPQD